MMFMNLNAKSSDTNAGTSSRIIKTQLQAKHSQKQAQIVDKLVKGWQNRLVGNDNTISYQRQNYASDKKDPLQQMYINLKGSLKKTFTNTVYTPLTFYQFHMIDHLYKLYQQTGFINLSQYIAYNPYIQNYIHILTFTKEVVKSQTVSHHLKHYVTHKLKQLIKELKEMKFAPPQVNKQSLYIQSQTNILLMILTFKSLQKQYNPYVRRIIKRIFNQLSAQSFMNTMQTLRYLQNQRQQIQKMPQITQQELTNQNNRILMQTYEKFKRKGKIPKIHLKKVSQDKRRKVVNLLISGFLSEDQDKKTQWNSLLNCMPDSEVYGLDWQSQSMTKLMGFMASTVGDLLFTKTTLQDKFIDNPFNPAFLVAQQSGKYLAYIVDQLFPNQFINIIGYSLGTQLIKQFIKTTIDLNKGKNLQKIILLGGVSDSKQYDQLLNKSPFPLSITNMFTANDTVLEVLLKRCRKGIQPIGLKELVKSIIHSIDNTDVSNQVSGHLAYMANFGKLADLLQLSEQ